MAERNNTLVCFAVKEEAADFRRGLDRLLPVDVLVSGIGPRNADQSIRRALEYGTPALVLTCGFAGALDPKLKLGDVVFDADPESRLAEVLRSLGAGPAKFHGSDRVAATAAAKAALRRTTGADAVEMESSVIRAICRERGIPGATVRVISDVAGQDLPLDFNAVMGPDGNISMAKLAGALLKSPGKVPRLLELRRDTRLAARRLADVLLGLLRSNSASLSLEASR